MAGLFTARSSTGGEAVVELSVTAHVREAERLLTATERRHLPFATALALTRTAIEVQKVEKQEIARVFDRPTRWALNAPKVRPARRNDWPLQTAEVFIPGLEGRGIGGGKYLFAQVHGGPRRAKRHEVLLRQAGILQPDEFTVPARGVPLDAHGNLPGALFQRILSQLRARNDPAQNETERSRRRRLRSRTRQGGHYFVGGGDVRRGPPRPANLPRGVYERWGARSIRAVLIFVRQPRYGARYDFYGIADRVARERFPREFELALMRASATAR